MRAHTHTTHTPPPLPCPTSCAAFLCRFGVPVRIIDSRAAPTGLSKALVIWRRSLLTLDPLIPCEEWLQDGLPVIGPSFADDGNVFASLQLQEHPVQLQQTATSSTSSSGGSSDGGTVPAGATGQQPQQHMLPAGILIPQSDVEAHLTQLLQDRYDVKVERSTQLTSFTIDDTSGGVRCTLADAPPDFDSKSMLGSSHTPDQQVVGEEKEQLVASYLIGCDGARSAVRKGLGVPFNGYTSPDQRWVLADCSYEYEPGINPHQPRCEVEARPLPGRIFVTTSAGGAFAAIPIGRSSDTIRLVWNLGLYWLQGWPW